MSVNGGLAWIAAIPLVVLATTTEVSKSTKATTSKQTTTTTTTKGGASTSAASASSSASATKDAAGIGKVVKTNEEWKKQLTPEQYRVLREKGTEIAFTGKYWNLHDTGIYLCAACGLETVRLGAQVRIGHGLAELHRADRGVSRARHPGHEPRDGSRRGRVRALRRAPRPRVRRWARADGSACTA